LLADGGGVLELHLSEPNKVRAAVTALAGVGSGSVSLDEVSNVITIPVNDGARSLVEAVRRLDTASLEIAGGGWHLLILDEVHNAIALGLLSQTVVVAFLDYAKSKVEHIITTGRDAPKEIIDHADLVTEMKEIKHPYQTGRFAEKGLDF
jgi:cob(I)alamin adenosyltransferase